MKCPKCGTEIGRLSDNWQSQRESARKRCHACGEVVEIVLDGKTFARWFCGTAGAMFAGISARGVDWPLALFFGFMFGASISVLPSFSLRIRKESERGLRYLLNRPLDLPTWLTPTERTRKLGKSVWAGLSVLMIVLITLLNVPSPWSGVLLLCAGGFGLWRRTVWFSWFKLVGNGAIAYSAVLILVGAGVVFTTYV
jgi:predicted RNA-binding Zn-ribbon protein involved in translation (DUF1610 family)